MSFLTLKVFSRIFYLISDCKLGFIGQDRNFAPKLADYLCPLTEMSSVYLSAIAACAAASLAIGTRNGEQDT